MDGSNYNITLEQVEKYDFYVRSIVVSFHECLDQCILSMNQQFYLVEILMTIIASYNTG